MKTILSIPRVALWALALGSASVTATFAQTTTAPAPTCSAGGGHHHDHASSLTSDEKSRLKAARAAAFAANPSLQTEQASLKQQFETLKGEGKGVATKDQWQALHEQSRDFHQKLHAAEIAQDSTLAPVFAKLEAAHHQSP